MNLSQLRNYLQTGKLRFSEHVCKQGYYYRPVLDDEAVTLPSILTVGIESSHAVLLNRIARSLGLTQQELEVSQACRIGRECVLVLLACEMLRFCAYRRAFVPNEVAVDGVRAMAVSVKHLIEHIERCPQRTWNPDEQQAVNRILPDVNGSLEDKAIGSVAEMLVQAIHARSN